jgi:hypothetical protein
MVSARGRVGASLVLLHHYELPAARRLRVVFLAGPCACLFCVFVQVRGEGDRLRVQLLRHRPLVNVHPVPVLSRT